MRRYAAVEAVWTVSESNLGPNSVANPFQAMRYQTVTMCDIMHRSFVVGVCLLVLTNASNHATCDVIHVMWYEQKLLRKTTGRHGTRCGLMRQNVMRCGT